MTLASKITMVRIAFIPLFMSFMYLSKGKPGLWMWLSLAVFVIASLTDYIDGHVARKYNQVSDFGKFLDPLADKLLVISAMVMFCQWGSFPAWALMIVLAREFAVTGLRLVAVGKGKVIAAGWSGKVKTACTMIGLCLMMGYPCLSTYFPILVRYSYIIDWLVLVVIVVTTIYSGFEYFIQNWKCLWED